MNQLPSNAPMWQRAALGAGAAIDILSTFSLLAKEAVITTHSFYKVSSRYFRFAPRQGAKLAAKGKMVQSAAKTSGVARGVLNPSAKGAQRLANAEKLLSSKGGVSLNRFNQSASQLSKTGKNNIRILRNWAKSKGWTHYSSNGSPEKWGVFNSTSGKYDWNLIIKPESSTRQGLQSGSGIPRFDARLGTGGYQYINPFSGQIGGKEIGRYISLEFFW